MKEDSCECKDSVFVNASIKTYAVARLLDEAVSLLKVFLSSTTWIGQNLSIPVADIGQWIWAWSHSTFVLIELLCVGSEVSDLVLELAHGCSVPEGLFCCCIASLPRDELSGLLSK